MRAGTSATPSRGIGRTTCTSRSGASSSTSRASRELLARSGVGPDTTVVLYGGNNNWFATYAYWLLRYLGFDRVRLVDGGRKKWELEDRELVTDEPTVAKADPGPLGKIRDKFRAFRDEVLKHIGGEGKSMVDVRSPAEFSGEVLAPPHLPQEQAQVPGHIPGAANVPWATAARDDGIVQERQELTEIYSGVGVTPDTDVIAYCRIGERSSHTWFVLHEILGYEGAQLRRLAGPSTAASWECPSSGSVRVGDPPAPALRSPRSSRARRASCRSGEGWSYERKLDGFRAIVFVDGDAVAIQSRAGKPLERYFPELGLLPGPLRARRRDRDHRRGGRRGVRPAPAAHPPGRLAHRPPGAGDPGRLRALRPARPRRRVAARRALLRAPRPRSRRTAGGYDPVETSLDPERARGVARHGGGRHRQAPRRALPARRARRE